MPSPNCHSAPCFSLDSSPSRQTFGVKIDSHVCLTHIAIQNPHKDDSPFAVHNIIHTPVVPPSTSCTAPVSPHLQFFTMTGATSYRDVLPGNQGYKTEDATWSSWSCKPPQPPLSTFRLPDVSDRGGKFTVGRLTLLGMRLDRYLRHFDTCFPQSDSKGTTVHV